MPGEAGLRVRARVAGDSPERPRLDVDLEIGGGITALMGPSGAGKTTLLATIAGLIVPEAGRIEHEGVVLYESDRRAFVPAHRRRIALVFQSLALFPHLAAWENVAYGLPAPSGRAVRRERALAWLERVHIAHLAHRAPASLSGGEAQRVALARALASEPRALLLDEPFSALDSQLRQEIGTELGALIQELGIPALLVTHHRDDAKRLAARVIEIERGRVVSRAASEK